MESDEGCQGCEEVSEAFERVIAAILPEGGDFGERERTALRVALKSLVESDRLHRFWPIFAERYVSKPLAA